MPSYSFEHAESLKPLIQWREYGHSAFDEAKKQKKPIFLLLTAPSWCHWCQVYESEEYLFHPDIIAFLNTKFIPIYVDADQRQDITRQYLEGGWPSTTILTPDRKRLFGYSGPRPVREMLSYFQQAYEHVQQEQQPYTHQYQYTKDTPTIPKDVEKVPEYYAAFILANHDHVYGGFGTGQKFPQGRALNFAIEWYETTNDERYLQLVQRTLEHQHTNIDELQTNYNLFDPVEGGFHRYGTTRQYTPPHYEKMLFDNARLLKAYVHLQKISPHPIVKEVIAKTRQYMETEWYNGNAFYGNTDVAGEGAYYHQNPRIGKARVEPTIYTDWNSEAILTYLYMFSVTKEEKCKSIAESTLEYFHKQMITDLGAYHYVKDGKKAVRGNITDNALLLLAFVEAADILGQQQYKNTAIQVANYTLQYLYDWNSGGFFERNSPDLELYAEGEHLNVRKPDEENGIMSYALLRLYLQTSNKTYLLAGLRTLGSHLDRISTLDTSYYSVKAAQTVIKHDLLALYAQNQETLELLEKGRQRQFWLSEMLSK